jgi:dolichol-phosphate mannosyltransferase
MSETSLPELTVVIPCYNERPNVAPMAESLARALEGIAWEAVFVDDASPDGTAAEVRRIAAHDPRIRCLLRIGRRGLSSAVIEGAMAAAAPYVAVMDGDGQHDEAILPRMLRAVREDGFDIAVGSRHAEGGDASGLASGFREKLSSGGTRVAQGFLPVPLADPMSGYFLLSRALFEQTARHLTGNGFKILVDLVLSMEAAPRIKEIPYVFRPRLAGESKLDVMVLLQFAALLLDKTVGGALPLRFVSFALVGGLGVLVHLGVFVTARAALAFGAAQLIATACAMVFNFWLNNAVTYRDRRLKGLKLARGLVLFMAVCSVGAIANIGIADALYNAFASTRGLTAGAIGAAIGVVWNYAVSTTLVWNA